MTDTMPRVPTACGNEDCRQGWLPVSDEWALDQSGGDPIKFAAARNSVVPCPQDNPAGYERWITGHYEPNHHCEDCDPRRRSRS